ncbi:hypothetical protein [Euzebyella saccharophila]|uniref:Uncharacterized protein n=1 Tax=Euzebyella saccharophila TaxID=679664 RepID=A0ABV8JLD0_9FLAO|nr:hypothetical protein [Euzebyella saccharophila]
MKSFARFTLLVLWLFAIAAPSVITLCDVDNPIVVTNINEEEQQELGKKSPSEEKIVNEHFMDYALIFCDNESKFDHYRMLGHFELSLEIISPPPEQSLVI